MPTFGEAIGEATRLTLCSLFAGNEAINALLSPVFGDSFGLYPASSGLRRKLCSDDPANDPTYDPDFVGGQCNADYVVTYRFNSILTNGNTAEPPITENATVAGPISGIRGTGMPEFQNIVVDGGNGPDTVRNGSCAQGCFRNIQLISVTRVDGLPDNCGDVPPPPAEPGPIIAPPGDVTYNIDGDTTITVPIGFVFAPAYVDINGELTVPVEFTVDGLEFNGEVQFNPEFNFEFQPKFIKPGPGVPDGDDGAGGEGGEGTPVPEDEDDFAPIIGVLVYSSVVGNNSATVLDSTDGPNIYAPRIGSVQFAIKTGNSTGWTADQDVKNLESYVPCPAPQGAIAVRVTPAPGITRTFTPVRGKPLTPP